MSHLVIRVLVACVAAAAMWAMPASAALAEGDPTFTRTPGQGPTGTVIQVAGTGCSYQGQPYERAVVHLMRNVAAGGGEPWSARQEYPIAADGTWGGTITVPADAQPGPHFLQAECEASDMVFPAPDSDFTVTGSATPRTTTTTTSLDATTTTQAPPTTVAVTSTSVAAPVADTTSTTNGDTTTTARPGGTDSRDDSEAASGPRDDDQTPTAAVAVALLALTGAATVAGAVAVRRGRAARSRAEPAREA